MQMKVVGLDLVNIQPEKWVPRILSFPPAKSNPDAEYHQTSDSEFHATTRAHGASVRTLGI